VNYHEPMPVTSAQHQVSLPSVAAANRKMSSCSRHVFCWSGIAAQSSWSLGGHRCQGQKTLLTEEAQKPSPLDVLADRGFIAPRDLAQRPSNVAPRCISTPRPSWMGSRTQRLHAVWLPLDPKKTPGGGPRTFCLSKAERLRPAAGDGERLAAGEGERLVRGEAAAEADPQEVLHSKMSTQTHGAAVRRGFKSASSMATKPSPRRDLLAIRVPSWECCTTVRSACRLAASMGVLPLWKSGECGFGSCSRALSSTMRLLSNGAGVLAARAPH